MKRFILLISTLSLAVPAKAQLFSGESLRGAALGGLLGGIIGHNSGRKTAEGIGIGAASGLVLGHLTREKERYDTYIPSRSRSVYADTPPTYSRPNYAVTGAALGGLAGGIIGHNSGRKTMEGVGIGAASGLVLGGLVENQIRRNESRHYYAQEALPNPNGAYYQNAPQIRSTSFPQPITTRAVGQGAIVTTSQASPTAGSTLITRIPVQSTTPAVQGLIPLYRQPTQTSGQQPINAQTVIINNYYGNNPSMGSANKLFGR